MKWGRTSLMKYKCFTARCQPSSVMHIVRSFYYLPNIADIDAPELSPRVGGSEARYYSSLISAFTQTLGTAIGILESSHASEHHLIS